MNEMAVKLKWVILRKLNIENYHDNKKLTVSQKISLTGSIFLFIIKMSQNLP